MGEAKYPQDQNSASSLRQAIEVISSLISLSHSIKVFTVKWQLIRNKLEELNSGLIAVENCDSSESSGLSSLVQAILFTVNECNGLARRCVDLCYGGKLLMQSDLDVLSSKFDQHIKNLSGIYTAGVLTQGFAIVVSRPGVNACKDDMRFYLSLNNKTKKKGKKKKVGYYISLTKYEHCPVYLVFATSASPL